MDPENAVRRDAPKIAEAVRVAGDRARNEAELRTAITRIIGDFTEQLDLDLDLREEYTLINGRADAVYNRFVVEYEPPGSLRDGNRYQSNQHALGQVKQYLEELSQVERHRLKRLAGVATDGHYFIFVRFREGHWHVDDALPVTASSTERLLRYLSSLSTELALSPENLLRDFGGGTAVAAACVGTLYYALSGAELPKVRTLFEQWQLQFSEVCGWERQSSRLDIPVLASDFGVHEAEPDPLSLFFVIHTYYATFIKLLAVQIASYYAFPMLGTGLQQVATYSSEKLLAYLEKMERGGVFADFGVSNFLEGDFFGWYLDLWGEEIDQAIRQVITQLALYSLVTLDVDPEETRDLLKKLYQNLMPRKLRHALGEYYTPDWLAERLLNQLCGPPKKGALATIDPAKRLLDPACGSGTFLVLAIRRMRTWAEERMMPEHEALEKILANVVGFDLNPLAVISARTNYLLALGELIQHRRGEISIPVYLADSIMTPSSGETLFDQNSYTFNTAVGKFSVPRVLVEAQSIDRLAALLEESVDVGLSADQFERRASEAFPPLQEDEGQLGVARGLYERLQELNAQGINGIWARVIKNAFAPLFQGRFDYVMGNPPWVNWESLPEEYRARTVALWHHHGLFPHSGMEAILGKGKKDISMLMTYVAMDDYLKDRGRLGFLITQSVFKTSGAGQGFRRFRLGSGTPIRVVAVDDMAKLKPFEGASNRTAIIVLERGLPTKYPVKSYSLWYKPGGGAVIPEEVSLEQVRSDSIATYREFRAEPVNSEDLTSPWMTGRPQALGAVAKILGRSDYQAKAGACTWLNGVYWLRVVGRRPDGLLVVTNVTEGVKVKISQVQAAIETDLVYPLLRGRDVVRWGADPSGHILMVQDPQKRRGYDVDWLRLQYPRTYGYLKGFEDELRRRSGYRRYFRASDPFYSIFDVAEYTFAPWKVVWRGQVAPTLIAAVVDLREGRCIVPDQTVYFAAVDSAEEGHYLCSLLNSLPVRGHYRMRGYKHVSMTFVQGIQIPKYDVSSSSQRRLAALSQAAHEATAAGDTARVKEIEEKIDLLAAELWGLTPQELEDIKRSLEELS
ncbi:MAG TPA: N-6 DNA methylase [Anaerolineae bacterium]|nr:N-6 DNA methylase [Anaerolineae bacterium]